ncbi:M1 family metallopeptidase [Flavobacterium sp. XGLA_31]|uniref:M1 family metallopeptidase n=1 Tax=Flavobacterium sp. XGLA_31 TaxID=3447666 RepID=UPI003F32E950
MKNMLFYSLILIGLQTLSAQEIFTRKDSLQGGLRSERNCFDVLHYALDVKINPEDKSIIGSNTIQFKIAENTKKIQLDLFENMQIDSIVFNSKKLHYQREFNAVFIDFPFVLTQNSEQTLQFYYSGKPIVARNAPWDGGFVFTKDLQGKPWIGVACQGTGASLWYPVKDSQSDEPDFGATIKVTVPDGLTAVANGRLISRDNLQNGDVTWYWEVKNPINTYDINITIADFVHLHDTYNGLDLDYYVLKQNEAEARIQFEEVKPMMECFQTRFGEYPFKEDGYKLVETPYLGMEHQSAVAYGNKYLKGYRGNDLSGTGLGLLFDYIIIHESGHEWFGNSITSKDIADMWIHEGFTMYSEAVYMECQYGYEKAQTYINGMKSNVSNDKPIIGPYGVNKEGSGDMYYKGALLLNTIRHIINDDSKWWSLLLKYSLTYRHKIIDTETVVSFFNSESGMNLTSVFNQYLRYPNIPRLEYKIKQHKLVYRWNSDEAGFVMPIDLKIKGKKIRITPTNSWTISSVSVKKESDIEVLTNDFFVNVN